MISADVKAVLKQEIKQLVAVSIIFCKKIFKTLNKMQNSCVYFSFNFGCYSIQLEIVD